MAVNAPVNAEPEKVVVIHTARMAWEKTEHPGVYQKVLERVNDPHKGRETTLLRLDPNTAMPPEELATRIDIFVLEGSFGDGHGTYGKHSFVRNPAGSRQTLSSKEGCVLYVKRRVPIRGRDAERLVVDAATAQWTPFPQRSATVLHLYRDMHGVETARLGELHPNGKIPTHDHAMGEESFIVRGIFKDEHHTYEPGTWFRYPIGVPHTPYTDGGGCTMLIREGDLVW